MLTNEELIQIEHRLKDEISLKIRQKKYDLALRLVEYAVQLQYDYSYKMDLYDSFLENALQDIANDTITNVEIDGDDRTVMFYDYFGYDNRGLTQQYLRALMHNSYRIILVFRFKVTQYKNDDILSEIADYTNKEVYYLEGDNRCQLSQNLSDILKREQPKRVLMHLAPWDTVAYMVFYKTQSVERYQINLTDHAFWLGVDITDYNLEFRSYGLNLSEQFRQISPEKSRILPYYPILSINSFQGFDFDITGKKIIFSGGSFYKVSGNNLEFFKVIKNILQLDEKLIFVFAGSGSKAQEKLITNFFLQHNLSERVYLLGDRYDLFEIFKHVHYYIATFPMIGALMSQIAAAANIPIYTYLKTDYCFNDLKDLFYKSDDYTNYATVEALINEFKQNYLNDERHNNLSESMITAEEFADNLEKIFSGENPFKYLEKRYDALQSYRNFNKMMLSMSGTRQQVIDKAQTCLSQAEINKLFPEVKKMFYKELFKRDKVVFFKTIIYNILKR